MRCLLFLVLTWSHAGVCLEGCAEVALACEAGHFRNFHYAEPCRLDKGFCFFQPYPGDIFLGTGSGDRLHLVVKGGAAHAELAAEHQLVQFRVAHVLGYDSVQLQDESLFLRTV